MSAHGLKITNFHYSGMTMPTSNPTQYPKWVYREPMGQGILARDAEEEARILAAVEPPKPAEAAPVVAAPAPAVTLTGENDEREILLKLAGERNIKVDKRWNTDRIRAALDQAGPQ